MKTFDLHCQDAMHCHDELFHNIESRTEECVNSFLSHVSSPLTYFAPHPLPYLGPPAARETANTPRPMQAHNMILAAQRWIAATHPHLWTRRGGRDHVWLMAHDEGACYAPAVIWPGEGRVGADYDLHA